jgi:hypothetical protein
MLEDGLDVPIAASARHAASDRLGLKATAGSADRLTALIGIGKCRAGHRFNRSRQ